MPMTTDESIERYAYVPAKSNEGKPLLAVHMQYDKVLDEYFALFPVEASMSMPRFASDHPGEALQKGACEVIRRLPPGVPLDIYHLGVVQKHGRFVPHVSMSKPVLSHEAARFKYVVWERGGMAIDKQEGAAQVVTNLSGAKLKPAIIRQAGHLANSRHAAFSIYPKTNLVIVNAHVHRAKQSIQINRLEWENTMDVPCLVNVWQGVNHNNTPNPYYDAVCSALDKANTVNCKAPVFICSERNH